MKTLPAQEIKNNSPACVKITEAQAAHLTSRNRPKATQDSNVLQYLLHKKSTGKKKKEELDAYLAEERNEWER